MFLNHNFLNHNFLCAVKHLQKLFIKGLSVPSAVKIKDYNGMLPCFLGGLLWRLFFNISKDRII